MEKNVCLLTVFVLISGSVLARQSPVIADGAEIQLVSDAFSFTEGPATDAAGNVYFTDQPNNRIVKWMPNDSISVFMEKAGRANGLYFDNDGNLLACADEKSELWKIDVDDTSKVEVLLDGFKGKRLNGPNDLWVDKKGGIYFTDPYYQRDYWERTEKEIEQERVYYLTPDRKDIHIAADDLVKPNGIIGTPDGSLLYVADIGDQKTYAYTVNQDGSLSDKKLFTKKGSDGMTIDREGNIYLTGNGVFVFDKEGNQIEHISIPENWTANVTFGGPALQTLFITASKSVYTLEMKVKGAE